MQPRYVGRIARAMCVGWLALSMSACGEDEVSAVGIWALRTVDGGDLPAELSDDGTTVVSIRQALLVLDSQSCLLVATYVTTTSGVPGEEEVSLLCEWEQTGGQVSLGWDGGGMIGTVDATFLNLTDQAGFDFVYERI